MREVNDVSVTEPLRDEHRELLPHIESLRAAAEATEGDADTLLPPLDEALAFLYRHLIPHAQAEDAVLYPKVEQAMHAPGATATMRRDHVEVVAMTQELQQLREGLGGQPTVAQRRSLQRVLYGLYAVIRLHFAKEEEVYVPVLDETLTPDEADAMFTAMHKAAHRGSG
jgi:iron-sulfur cluster repair protein YtfE (RIC family)